SLRLSTATRYRLIVHLHDLRERPPASGCPGRASPAEERFVEDPRRPGGLPHHTYFSFPAAKRTDFSSASRAESNRASPCGRSGRFCPCGKAKPCSTDRKSTRLNSSH